MEFVWVAVLIVVIGGMWWIGYRMEPHWISKDGQRFMCGTQEFFHGVLAGHPRETQVAIMPGALLHITHKRMMRRKRSMWTLLGKSADPPKGLEIFVAEETIDGVPTQTMLALRIPRKSRCVEILNAELAKADAEAARSRPGPSTPKTS